MRGRKSVVMALLPCVLLVLATPAYRVRAYRVRLPNIITTPWMPRKSQRTGSSPTSVLLPTSDIPEVGPTQEVVSVLPNLTSGRLPAVSVAPSAAYSEGKEIRRTKGGQVTIFKLVKLLGSGGCGDAWEVSKRLEGAIGQVDKAVLKIIIAFKWDRKFEKEIALQSRVDDEHVVKVFDHFVINSDHFIELELASDGDVMDMITEKRNCPEEAQKDMLRQVALGLQSCHAAGVAHLDVKPDNVVISGGTYKLIDFGLAAAVSVPETYATLTEKAGTVTYVAPELLSPGSYRGAPADVWSLGIMMHGVMTGHSPFDVSSFVGLAYSVRYLPYTPNKGWGHWKTDLMQRMLTKKPDDRITIPEILAHPWLSS